MERVTSNAGSATLGLVAGLGVGAGIFYYRTLVNAFLSRGLAPRLVIVHADVRKVLDLAGSRRTSELARYLAGLLQQPAHGGAQLATIPAFVTEICAQELAQCTPLPLIGLLDAIIDETSRRYLRRVAVFGARVTVETSLFGRLENVTDVIAPRPEEIDLIGGIYSEIVRNEKASLAESEALRTLAHTLIQRERLDAILLAGTDLSLVFDPATVDFPHLDGARVYIDEIVRRLTC